MISDVVDDLGEIAQGFLHSLGFRFDVAGLPGDVVAMLAMLLFAGLALRVLVEFVEGWRDGSKIFLLVNFVLVVVGYVAGTADGRSLGAAFAGVARDGLADLLPPAVLTQWTLICLFWVTYGLILRVGPRLLVVPLHRFLILLLQAALVLGFVAVWVSADRPWDLRAIVPAAVLLVGFGYLRLVQAGGVQLWAKAASGPRPLPRWRLPLGEALPDSIATAGGVLLVAAVISWAFWDAGHRLPTFAEVAPAVGLVLVLIFLRWCIRFREETFDLAGVPAQLAAFADLALTLTVVVAGFGAVGSTGPAAAVAAAAALVVAIIEFVLLLRHRREPGWARCVLATLVLAALAVPLSAALRAVVPDLTPSLGELLSYGARLLRN